MKIAFLNIYNGRVLRGSEIFVSELAKRLSNHHIVQVFQTGITDKKPYKTVIISNIPFLTHQQGLLSSALYSIFVFVFTMRCIPILLKENFDWIIPINGRFQVLLCRFLRLFKGTRILVSGHSGIGFDDKVNLMIGRPDVFVALSKSAAKWAQNIKGSQKVVYIPNGIDTKKFNPTIPAACVRLKKPIILCVAALVPYKRISLLIDAVSQVDNTSLMIIGDGPQKEKILQTGRLKLGDRFLLLPNISHDKMPSYYRVASVFSLPSKEYESFGLAYLESLACNIPVVAPDDENRRKLLGEAGIYCDVTNVQEYALALKKALQTDFNAVARNRAMKYSWDKITKEYEHILEKN